MICCWWLVEEEEFGGRKEEEEGWVMAVWRKKRGLRKGKVKSQKWEKRQERALLFVWRNNAPWYDGVCVAYLVASLFLHWYGLRELGKGHTRRNIWDHTRRNIWDR